MEGQTLPKSFIIFWSRLSFHTLTANQCWEISMPNSWKSSRKKTAIWTWIFVELQRSTSSSHRQVSFITFHLIKTFDLHICWAINVHLNTNVHVNLHRKKNRGREQILILVLSQETLYHHLIGLNLWGFWKNHVYWQKI